MPDAGFHFASPWWLLGLLLILPVGGWLRRSAAHGSIARMNRYADSHLLPHLTGSRELAPRERWRRFIRWSLLWTALVVAMSGPRWDYTQVQLFTPGADLVILLDISRSMTVSDVKPSRLTRARQEIEDLLNLNGELRIGLIAFASVAHVVAPITADSQAIRDLLPALSSDLVRLQGSRLEEALNRTRTLLAGQPEESSHGILLITDGDFADADPAALVQPLAAEGIRLHILGIGTPGGGPVPGHGDRFLVDPQRKTVESRLDVDSLTRLAELGGGRYRTADYLDDDTRAILSLAASNVSAQSESEARARIWNERFHWLLFPVALALLPLFRKTRPKSAGGRR